MYLSLYMLCCLVLLQRGAGVLPQKKILKYLKMVHFSRTKWIVIACSTGISQLHWPALTSAPSSLLVWAPGKYPHLPPLSRGGSILSSTVFQKTVKKSLIEQLLLIYSFPYLDMGMRLCHVYGKQLQYLKYYFH